MLNTGYDTSDQPLYTLLNTGYDTSDQPLYTLLNIGYDTSDQPLYTLLNIHVGYDTSDQPLYSQHESYTDSQAQSDFDSTMSAFPHGFNPASLLPLFGGALSKYALSCIMYMYM